MTLTDPPAASELAGVPCRVERRVWAGVPCLLERPLSEGPLRAVCVVFHGAWASKEGKLGVYSRLTAHAVLLVLPDAALHGERQGDTPAGLNAREYVWESVSRTVAETPALLDACAAEFGALPVWVIGSSMGGYVALTLTRTLARTENRVQRGAAAITSGVWREPLVQRPALREFMEANRPVTHAAQFPPVPLLLISGAQDTVFPAAEHHFPTAQALGQAYAAAGAAHLFHAQVLAGVGHFTSQHLRDEVIRFLTER